MIPVEFHWVDWSEESNEFLEVEGPVSIHVCCFEKEINIVLKELFFNLFLLTKQQKEQIHLNAFLPLPRPCSKRSQSISLLFKLFQLVLPQRILKQDIHYGIDNWDLDEHLLCGRLKHALSLGIKSGQEFLHLHVELEICLREWFIELKELRKVQYTLWLILTCINMINHRLYQLSNLLLRILPKPIPILEKCITNYIQRIILLRALLTFLIGNINLIDELNHWEFW